jgi:hypothetical protein
MYCPLRLDVDVAQIVGTVTGCNRYPALARAKVDKLQG